MAKLKMIQVESKTHTQAKRQAKKKNLSLKAYIQELLDSYNTRINGDSSCFEHQVSEVLLKNNKDK